MQKEGKSCCLSETREILLTADTMDAYIALFGLNDQNVAMIEQECSVSIALRGNHLMIQGDAANLPVAEKALRILFDLRGQLRSVGFHILCKLRRNIPDILRNIDIAESLHIFRRQIRRVRFNHDAV